jgi:hypothetical protein
VRIARRAAVLALLGVALAASSGSATAPPLTLDSAIVSATWKESWLTGAVRFSGNVGGAASLTVTIKPVGKAGAPPAAKATVDTAGGEFSGQLKLPARVLPGNYAVRAYGTSNGEKLIAVERDVVVPAPPEGIVDRAWATTTRGGPPMKRIAGPRTELWAHFHFLYPPKSGKITAAWYTPSFKYIGTVTRKYRQNFDTFVRVRGGLERGNWWVLMRSGNRVAIRVALRLS